VGIEEGRKASKNWTGNLIFKGITPVRSNNPSKSKLGGKRGLWYRGGEFSQVRKNRSFGLQSSFVSRSSNRGEGKSSEGKEPRNQGDPGFCSAKRVFQGGVWKWGVGGGLYQKTGGLITKKLIL